MKKCALGLAALAVVGAQTAQTAQAAATASASLGPLTITLFDLDPDDGVAPAITFATANHGYGTLVYSNAYSSQPAENVVDQQLGTDSFSPVASSASTSMSAAWSAVTGTGDAAGTLLAAGGHANGTTDLTPFGNQHSQFTSYGYAPNSSFTSFTLSANTLLLVSATSVLATDVSATFDPAASAEWEYAMAQTTLQISGPGASGHGSQSASDVASATISSVFVADDTCVYGYCYGPGSAHDTRALAVSFVNASSGDLSGYFFGQAYAYGYSYAQVVPEPASYALMLAGLGVVLARFRRRQD